MGVEDSIAYIVSNDSPSKYLILECIGNCGLKLNIVTVFRFGPFNSAASIYY